MTEELRDRVCSRCQSVQDDARSSPAIAELTARIESLFAVQPDMKTSVMEGGRIVAHDYGLATRENAQHADTHLAAREIAGHLWESFQRVFGERRLTSRRFWWRERPVLVTAYDFDRKSVKYAIWCRAAIEGLTPEEKTGLPYHNEGDYVRYIERTEADDRQIHNP